MCCLTLARSFPFIRVHVFVQSCVAPQLWNQAVSLTTLGPGDWDLFPSPLPPPPRENRLTLAHSYRAQSIMVEKSRQQDLEIKWFAKIMK